MYLIFKFILAVTMLQLCVCIIDVLQQSMGSEAPTKGLATSAPATQVPLLFSPPVLLKATHLPVEQPP